MRILKYILDFYIQSSLHVALAVFVLIRITFLTLNISYEADVAYFGFFGTIVGYNFIKYDELARVKKVVLTKSFKAIVVLSFLSALATFYFFLEINTNTKIIGFVILIITILYTLPFFPHQSNMRNWSGIKIYLVAISWVGVTVLLPVINADVDFSLNIILKCMQRFIFVLVLLLIFEIIDLQFDKKSLGTIPQKVGIKKTKLLSYLLILVFLSFEYFITNGDLNQFVVTFFVAIILGFFTYFANSNRNKYYSSFWAESVPVFWLVLLLIFR
jgi:hypothetical protein